MTARPAQLRPCLHFLQQPRPWRKPKLIQSWTPDGKIRRFRTSYGAGHIAIYRSDVQNPEGLLHSDSDGFPARCLRRGLYIAPFVTLHTKLMVFDQTRIIGNFGLLLTDSAGKQLGENEWSHDGEFPIQRCGDTAPVVAFGSNPPGCCAFPLCPLYVSQHIVYIPGWSLSARSARLKQLAFPPTGLTAGCFSSLALFHHVPLARLLRTHLSGRLPRLDRTKLRMTRPLLMRGSPCRALCPRLKVSMKTCGPVIWTDAYPRHYLTSRIIARQCSPGCHIPSAPCHCEHQRHDLTPSFALLSLFSFHIPLRSLLWVAAGHPSLLSVSTLVFPRCCFSSTSLP